MSKNLLFKFVIHTLATTLLISGCVVIEVGLEPIPSQVNSPLLTETPILNIQLLGPDYSKGIEAIGWLGRVYSLPTGSEYSSVLILEPQGAGIVAAVGNNADVETQLKNLRDTGKQANFWGKVTCGKEGSFECVFAVDRVRAEGPGPFFDMDQVNGWYGTLIGQVPNSEVDDAFVLAGDFPIQFGVGSNLTLLDEAINSLENTDTGVRLWGQIICGVPDAGNCHIYATDLNIISDMNPTRPTETPSVFRLFVKPDSSWLIYTNEVIGLQFQYPPDASVIALAAAYLPPKKQPQNESDEEILDMINRRYGNTLCLQIRYRLGNIFISPPYNRSDKYVQCLQQGLPQGEIINKYELVPIESINQTFNGFEIVSNGFSLDKHSETFAAHLSNGFTIQYGSMDSKDATYASYLLTTKQSLLAILSSIKFTSQ